MSEVRRREGEERPNEFGEGDRGMVEKWIGEWLDGPCGIWLFGRGSA